MKDEIAILYEYKKPPWGGGNQFLLAIKKAFINLGFHVTSVISESTKACLFNSHNVDFSYFENKDRDSVRMVHRIDGPISLYRGIDLGVDKSIFYNNNKFANATVFQSNWSLSKTLEFGYKPMSPVVIPNASDSKIFNRIGKKPFSPNRKTRIISTSWSDNTRKGYPVYKWLDKYLDWDRFEYTFLGRVPGTFKNIRLIPAQPSEKVAKILKEHDIYITASKNEPCSNALTEALSCGLPALYLNMGSHHEIVKSGGLCFDSNEEIMVKLDEMVGNYASFQNSIVVQDINEIAIRYLDVLGINL